MLQQLISKINLEVKIKFSILLFTGITSCYAANVQKVIEFFSFTCSHCVAVEPKLQNLLIKTNAKYAPVVVPSNERDVPVAMVYYACIRKNLGWQFRNAYFQALQDGYPANDPRTVLQVLTQITNKPMDILSYSQSQDIIDKLNEDKLLIKKFNVSSTPTFVINGNIKLEGDNALDGLLQ